MSHENSHWLPRSSVVQGMEDMRQPSADSAIGNEAQPLINSVSKSTPRRSFLDSIFCCFGRTAKQAEHKVKQSEVVEPQQTAGKKAPRSEIGPMTR